MKIRMIAALLLAAACALRAENFGDVRIDQQPGFLVRGGFGAVEFRVKNSGVDPAVVELGSQMDGYRSKSSVVRTLLVPPGGTVTACLYLPFSHNDWYNDSEMKVRVNGRWFKNGFWMMTSSHVGKALLAPNWSTTIGLRRAVSQETALATSQWPSRPQFYAGLGVIGILAAEPPPPAVMETLENYAKLGGNLEVCVPDGTGEAAPEENIRRYPLFGGRLAEIPASALKERMADYNDYNSSQYGMSESGSQYDLRGKLPVPEVPVIWLTLLMLGFVVVIGPVNYIVLRRMHREMWLLFTTPLLSFIFCAAVVAAISLNEGWNSIGVARGLTWLDQPGGTAVTRALVGVYSPLGFAGLNFDYDELVCFDPDGRGEVNLDLTAGQNYSRSIAQPRVPLFYKVSGVFRRSERLTFHAAPGGGLEVVNGLGADVKSLAVRADGKVYVSRAPIAAGERAVLPGGVPFREKSSVDQYTVWNTIGYRQPGLSDEVLVCGFDDFTYVARCKQPMFYNPGTVPDQFDAEHIVVGRFDGVEK